MLGRIIDGLFRDACVKSSEFYCNLLLPYKQYPQKEIQKGWGGFLKFKGNISEPKGENTGIK